MRILIALELPVIYAPASSRRKEAGHVIERIKP